MSNNKFIKITLVAAILAMSPAIPAKAASLRLVPVGAQLDTDPINDIGTHVGDFINFAFEVDTTGLTAPLASLTYRMLRDSNELVLLQVNPNTAFFPNFTRTILTGTDTNVLTEVSQSGGSIAPNTVFNTINPLDQVGSGLINDGISDFRIVEIVSAFDTNGNDVTSQFTLLSPGGIEVQPVPEPTANFALLGLGALGIGSLLKKKLASS